jgi:hypothetical protein
MLASPNPQSALTSSNSAVITEQSTLIRAATPFHTELCRNKVIREPRRCHARTQSIHVFDIAAGATVSTDPQVTTAPDGFPGSAPAWRTIQDDVDDGLPFGKPKGPAVIFRVTTNSIGQYWNAGMDSARCVSFASSLHTLRLTELYLQSNSIGDDGVSAVAAALPRTQISVLNLSSNNIGPMGAAALASALPLSQLTVLEARHNTFGDDGSRALARALPGSSVLCLVLSFNKIGAAGASDLAGTGTRTVTGSAALTGTRTGTNALRGVGDGRGDAAALGRSSLRELNLASNEISDEGGEKIGRAVAGHTVLTVPQLP